MSSLSETLQSNLNNPASSPDFDLYASLEEVLGGVGLKASDSGGKITFYGKDPIVPSWQTHLKQFVYLIYAKNSNS
jgi:hypothetical protein